MGVACQSYEVQVHAPLLWRVNTDVQRPNMHTHAKKNTKEINHMMRARRPWPRDFVTMHAMYTPRDDLWSANDLKAEL